MNTDQHQKISDRPSCQPRKLIASSYMEEGGLHGNEKIQRAQIQQESWRGSAHRDASYALGQAQGEEPQAGHCHWPFQGAAERRQGAEKKSGLGRYEIEQSRARSTEAQRKTQPNRRRFSQMAADKNQIGRESTRMNANSKKLKTNEEVKTASQTVKDEAPSTQRKGT
jgi:hypothetical protein